MRYVFGLALATLLALPAAQAAADAPAAPVEHIFQDADLVTGGRPSATEGVIRVRRNPGASSLIRVRASFVQELLKDAEDL
ncbi:MAG: hypothetical protein IPG17_21455 [Sandaracinaceae bacterium]|jgi:hypothetical protein|nr:hypothetical protein [Sandaracinaceae bacterium]